MHHSRFLIGIGFTIVILSTAVTHLHLFASNTTTGGPSARRATTISTTSEDGRHLQTIFEGIKPDARFSLAAFAANQHQSGCGRPAAPLLSRLASFVDRTLGIQTVHAQGCPGAYWCDDYVYCGGGGLCANYYATDSYWDVYMCPQCKGFNASDACGTDSTCVTYPNCDRCF